MHTDMSRLIFGLLPFYMPPYNFMCSSCWHIWKSVREFIKFLLKS